MASCQQCQASFEITEKDRGFYERFGVPEPQLCPDCRNVKRLAWRNERSLYRRKCDKTGKSVISFYRPDSPYTVYDKDEWWTDSWNGKDFGRDFNFSRPFFEQFNELLHQVPHMAMVISHGENSDYCPWSYRYKNSYLCASGANCEDCYYTFWMIDSRDCMDCYCCIQCERCYECLQCINLYDSIFCVNSDNSHELAFCMDCDGCSKCIGCFGLKHQEYYVFNQKVSPEEYERVNRELRSSYQALEAMKQKVTKHFQQYPRRPLELVNTENCTGDYLLNCKNVHDCYMSRDSEDCAYTWNNPSARDAYDCCYSVHAEELYNVISAVNGYHHLGTICCWDSSDVFYSFQSFSCKNIFGCVGLKQEQYCILNKQYTKEAYEKLVPKIIEHMKNTPYSSGSASAEWGEFFPVQYSPFAYNETIAQEWFPLSKEQVLERGWKWSDYEESLPEVEKVISADQLPEGIDQIPDDILQWAVKGKETGKPFKVIPQELAFYRQMNLPLPRLHPTQRHLKRQQQQNPRQLWQRTCGDCGQDFSTSFPPNRSETVVCEACYLKRVY